MFLRFLKSRPALKVILALALTTGWLHAAPYGPDGIEIERTQPGGSKISLLVFGDTSDARTENLDGYTVWAAGMDLVAGCPKAEGKAPAGLGLSSFLAVSRDVARSFCQETVELASGFQTLTPPI